ncbi:DNA polymerase I [Arthrobacter phage Emotion]|uniref:DNA polymerase I n=1 Tax=Arthrobacter phage Emotion TaxID=3038361 RepID=A0AA49EQZ9_9CAUD|nr:DNA polymerase I [Arthrobacter phage Emotion]
MITLTHTVAGDECLIYVPERRADLAGFEAFLAQGDKVLGLDTETTHLGIYESTFGCRLVQFGNEREAWVLRADLFQDAIARALRQPRAFIVHNAAFDLKVIDRTIGVRIEELADRVIDTRILAHLLDPRQPHEGGAGLSLKPLCTIYVDDNAEDTQAGLNAVFRTIRDDQGKLCTKDNGWRFIPIYHETYNRYAGLDVIYVVRLFKEIAPLVKEIGLSHLSKFEHHFQALVCLMERKGVLVDVAYTERLKADLLAESEAYAKVAARYGVANVNSTAQIAEALVAMGETLTETTPSGDLKVDKAVLLPLADLDLQWERIEAREPNPLANAVMRAKRASKWAGSYAQAFLDYRDEGDRLHASIGTLQARTARMSISRPPLQQLPSGDYTVRRAIVADPGHVIVTSDYDQIEMRVLAALADVKGIKQAIEQGVDLHGFTAELVYGKDYTKFHRKLMKGVGFGKVYGGGKATLSRQTGAPIDAVAHAIAEYDRVFPEIKRYSKALQSRAQYGKKEVVTVSGRHLPLDRDRLYAATNYVVQSTARDLLAQAIVDLFDAGLGDHLLLPVHDELVAQAPEGDAEEFARELGRIMSSTFYGVPLTSAGEVTGKNWGAAYGANPEEGSW